MINLEIKLKRKICFLLHVFALYISMLFPKNKNLILVGSWFGEKYADNSKFLYEYILKNKKNLKPVWMSSNEVVISELKKQGLPVCKSGTLEGIKKALRAKIVFWSTGREDIGAIEQYFIGGAIWINLWHGIPLKKIIYDDKFSHPKGYTYKDKIRDIILSLPLNKHYVVSSSQEITKIYEGTFHMNRKHILEIGEPRNDYFLLPHENLIREKYLSSKVIVYMPTHRNKGKVKIDLEHIFDLDDLNTLLESSNAFMLIKKHFYHKDEPKLDSSYSRIIELSNDNTDTQELLDAADILVTDYSSCYIDYLLLNRPMVFYAYDYDQYLSTDRQLYFDYDSTTPGPKCKNYTEFKTELLEVLNGNDNYQEERKKVGKIFYGDNIGKLSSPRVLKAVEKLMK